MYPSIDAILKAYVDTRLVIERKAMTLLLLGMIQDESGEIRIEATATDTAMLMVRLEEAAKQWLAEN